MKPNCLTEEFQKSLSLWLRYELWGADNALHLLSGFNYDAPTTSGMARVQEVAARQKLGNTPEAETKILAMKCERLLPHFDETARISVFTHCAEKYETLANIWKSGHELNDKNAPAFFIEWALSKDLTPDWLEWAIEQGLYCIEAVPVATPSGDEKPWLVANSNDPAPDYPWYTHARYFARQLVRDDSTLLAKKKLLAEKTAASLAGVGIFKRGKKKESLSSGTVLKSFVNVVLS